MKSSSLKTTFTGAIGNVLEWYDFAVFGFVAPLISDQFFPESDPQSALIKTFGVFAAGYLARPLGGVFFGQMGDRLGRKGALQLSVAMMAVPTTLMAILPTHEQVGLLAPVLLVILRFIQGISVGGEFIGSSTYLVEVAPADQRAYYGSWTMFGAVGGILLGSAVASLVHNVLSREQLISWGWRLPFLGGVLIGWISWHMRHGLQETREFTELQQSGKTEKLPALEALKQTPGSVLQVIGITVGLAIGIYTLFVWMPTYLTHFVDPPISHALLINTLAMTVLLGFTPLAGRIADRIGYKFVLLASSLGLVCVTYPLFLWIDSGSLVAVVVSMGVFAILMAGPEATLAVAMADLFPPGLRYSGTAIGYNLTLALFGGTAPMFATWLITTTKDLASPAIYVTIVAAVSFVVTLTIGPRRRDETLEQ